GAAFAVTTSVMRQLGGEPEYAREVIRELSEGNLTIEVATRDGDRDSLLATARDTITRLAEVMSNVTGAAGNVAAGSEQMASGSETLSQG
ncbi:hypothetical protein ABTE74_20400, partial [Acinetobacter baumannii]